LLAPCGIVPSSAAFTPGPAAGFVPAFTSSAGHAVAHAAFALERGTPAERERFG
jgi:hypothetical protein